MLRLPRCLCHHIAEFLLMLPIVALGLCGCGPSDIPGPRREGPLARSATAEPLARVEPSLVAERSLAPLPAASIPLGGEWRFSVDSDQVGEDEGWADPGFDDSAWMKVTVPHTWGVMEEHADYEGIAWYRRSLALPEAHDAHLRLRFDAVFYLARVWLNGEYLGEHEGGYTPFEFDVTAASKPGTENIVAVRVDNRRDMNRIPATLRRDWSYDWWNWGGIVRDVSLTATGRTFIAGQRVIAVPHLTGRDQADSATVTATVTVHNRSDRPVEGMVAGDVLDDAEGLSVIETQPTAPFNLGPGESTAIELAVEVTEPRLWHFDHPLLYRWSTSLQAAEGASLHRDEVTFGIRSVTLADARFTLNGEPMRLVGLTRHADSPRHGLAETVTVMARDYDDLKTLNMVFSRPVHYP
jgi:beta-galactosidase/beta-glucuronidase